MKFIENALANPTPHLQHGVLIIDILISIKNIIIILLVHFFASWRYFPDLWLMFIPVKYIIDIWDCWTLTQFVVLGAQTLSTLSTQTEESSRTLQESLTTNKVVPQLWHKFYTISYIYITSTMPNMWAMTLELNERVTVPSIISSRLCISL